MLTVGSLFSGIGGLELGLERTGGFRTAWQVENNPYATSILAKHWPQVARYGDVRGVGAGNLESVDLICGGFPCTDISNAGTTHEGGLTGLAGERSGLWAEFYRILCELQPRWVLVENVGAITVRGLAQVLHDLASCGFDADWATIPASAVGAPHHRKRLFIVGQRVIRYAHELPACDCCDEPWCPECEEHFADCAHEGSHSWPDVLEDTDREGLEGNVGSILAQPDDWRQDPDAPRPDWWNATPRVCRGVDGIPHRVDRLRCLGNAVVPQCAEYIGRMILEAAGANRP